MYDYLVDHALKNVWCTPEQDNQYVIKPKRISSPSGVVNNFKLNYRWLKLPDNTSYFHIYQIGQLSPFILGLMTTVPNWFTEQWFSIKDCCNQQSMLIDIYSEGGLQYPKHEAFYILTNEKNLLVAIKELPAFGTCFDSGDIYFRFYSNAFFDSVRGNNLTTDIHINGRHISYHSEILPFQYEYESYLNKSGTCLAYVNGLLVNYLNVLTILVGDVVEYVYDASIKRIVTLKLDDLETFTSELDNKRKYLIHYENNDDHVIDYLDDIDFYVVNHYGIDLYKGVYYHKNDVKNCRMVTHRDYSLAVNGVDYLLSNFYSYDSSNIEIKFFIRNSGYSRPLVLENNRIHELYKLPEARVISAMVGTDATVNVWQAAKLENSFYCKIMRAKGVEVNRQLVQDGYGYNALSLLLGNTPSKTILRSGYQQIDVPYGLQNGCTAYEYDSDGKLLEINFHTNGSIYSAENPNTRLVELISGFGSHNPNVVFGINNLPVPIYDNYRVYLSHTTNDGYDGNWSDITGSTNYHINNQTLVYDTVDPTHFLMIRSDQTFLAYNLYLIPTDGNLRFTLSEMENREGSLQHYTLPIPLGDLDLFLNGNALIEGLDYIVKFPEIVIFNKKHLTALPNTTEQWLHVRFTGFCNSNLTRGPLAEVGFIVHDMLSRNNKFDIRDDRVLRITVDGKLKHRDDLLFSETHSGVSVLDVDNGKPYQVKDIVVPIKDLANGDTYTLRAASAVIDKTISDYLTLMLPEPTILLPSAIPERYPIFSPFISKILYDLYTEMIPTASISHVMGGDEVVSICQPYEQWLAFDPIIEEHQLNPTFVIIHPHNNYNTIQLNLYQYRFLTNVVKIYARGLVELSPFIELKPIVA